jgi:hypothetical protein
MSLQTFRQNGIDEMRNVSLYLNLYQDKRGVQCDDDGEVIEHLKFDDPRKRTFKATTPNVHIGQPKAKPPADRRPA